MSITVDFYLLQSTTVDAAYTLACRLAEKAYQHQQTAYICCNNSKEVAALDQLLWTFKDSSFIPHMPIITAAANIAPIGIGHATTVLVRNYDILINLHLTITTVWQNFNRILDIVANDPAAKHSARQRYQHYRRANCQLNLHEL